MKKIRPELTLMIPGLSAPLPEGAAPLRLPALETLLARADEERVGGEDYAGVLAGLYGLKGELPGGAIALRGEGGMPGEAAWMHADPVRLVADRDKLYLGEYAHTSLEEARALAAELNTHLAEDGLQLLVMHGRRWYLRLAAPVALSTTSIDQALGRAIDGLLPQDSAGGDAAGGLRRLLTECQMLLHNSPHNVQRQARGEGEVNSLWLWGAGVLPESLKQRYAAVFADEPLARGLAYLSSVEPGPAFASFEAYRGHHRDYALMVLHELREARLDADEAARLQLLEGLERQWAQPLLAALKSGRLGSLRILSDDGRAWRLQRKQLWRIWRRRPGLGR